MMAVFKGKERLAFAVMVVPSILILWGCTTVTHSYNMTTSIAAPKSYAWVPRSIPQNANDPLLEANVQVLADRLLAKKGFTRVSDSPDLAISMRYEFAIGDSHHLQMLTLNVYRPVPIPSDMAATTMQRKNSVGKKELIWRGTAVPAMGMISTISTIASVSTSTSSGDLRKAVEKVLSKFPR
jgi:hypothetical protein